MDPPRKYDAWPKLLDERRTEHPRYQVQASPTPALQHCKIVPSTPQHHFVICTNLHLETVLPTGRYAV